MKKLLSLLMVLVMVLSMTTTVWAANGTALPAADASGVIKLTEDVALSSDYYIRSGTVTIDLNGHNITFANNMIFIVSNGHLHLTGTGTVSTTGKYPTVQVTGQGSQGTAVSQLTVDENVTLKHSDGYTVGVFAPKNTENSYGVTVNFAGKSEGASGISVNGSVKAGNPVINIKPTASIKAENTGIYGAGDATYNVENGAYIEGSTAVEVRAGKLNVNGGTFVATATTFATRAEGNGTTVIGAAIAVSQHTTNQPIDVNITGGDFSGVYALYETDTVTTDTTKSEGVDIDITGGTFETTSAEDDAAAVSSANITNFITGGTFSTDPTAYVADNTALIGHTSGGTTQYGVGSTAQTMASAAQAGDTITVHKGTDITVPNNVTVENKTANEITVNNKPVEANGTYTPTTPPSGGSYTPSGHEFTTTLQGINKVSVGGKVLSSGDYTVVGTNVIIAQAYIDKLASGSYTVVIENDTHIATGTLKVSGSAVQSAKTFDAGIAVYGVMALMSAAGAAYVSSKKR